MDFQTGHFADLEQLKIDITFLTFMQAKIDPTHLFILNLDRTVNLLRLGMTLGLKKQSKSSDKKFKNYT